MAQQIEFIIGLSLLITSLSVIINRADWQTFVEYGEKKGGPFELTLGLGDLLVGATIIAFHWIWHGLAIFTTIIGVILLIRGVVRLLFPRQVLKSLQNAKKSLLFLGIVCFIVSFFILYGWWCGHSNFMVINII